jgi:hypothetical protein
VLSRDATARPLGVAGLYELPVRLDWFARRKGVRLSLEELGASLAMAAGDAALPVGVMLHHELMDDDELTRAGELLAILAAHPRARCRLMSELTQSLPRPDVPDATSLPGGSCAVETAARS